MSTYPQFGYAYTSAGSQTTSVRSTELSTSVKARSGPSNMTGSGDAGGSVSPGYSSNNSCSGCENGRSLVNDPATGLPVCSCQYASATRLAGLATYPRLATTAVGVYGTPYPSTDQNPYPSIDSTFYSPLGTPYSIKEGIGGADMSTWTSGGLQTTPSYYHYDSTMAAYGYGTGYDLATRRKNATRESTTTLKAWLNEHKKNPYPTKGEKIMLAIITKMTLTQVSTWFANARRRLKKENKMTWEPKNRTDDDDDDDETMMSNYEEKDDGPVENDRIKDSQTNCAMSIKSEHDNLRELDDESDFGDSDEDKCKRKSLLDHCLQPLPINCQHHPHQHNETQYMKDQLVKLIPPNSSKPKIWSLADTAACKTPPPIPTQQPSTWSTASTFVATNPTYITTTQNGFINSDGSSSTGDGYSSRYSDFYAVSNGPSGGRADFRNSKTYASSQTSLHQRSPSTTNGYSEQRPVTHFTDKRDYSQLSNRKYETKHGGEIVNYAQQFRLQSQPVSQLSNHQNTVTVSQSPSKEIALETFYKKSESTNGTFAATI